MSTTAVKAGSPIAAKPGEQPPMKPATDEGGQQAGQAAGDPAAGAAAQDPPANGQAQAPDNSQQAGQAPATQDPAPEFDDEKFKAYMKAQGIEVNSIDDLKAKFAAPATEKTDAEKKAESDLNTQKMLQKHVAGGGTVEQFAALLQVASMDVKELGKASKINELKAAGFDDNEIANIIKERYEIDIASLTRDEDNETQEEFDKRKAALQKKANAFSKKYENVGTFVKQNATNTLNNLQKEIDAENASAQKEATFLSNVDKALKSVARTTAIDLGKEDDKEIAPVQAIFTDAHIAAVREILSDKAKRQQYLLTEDGSLDAEKVVKLVLNNVALTSIARASLLEGGTRQVKLFEQRFPNNASQLGVGGDPKKQQVTPGKIASAGTPQRVGQR